MKDCFLLLLSIFVGYCRCQNIIRYSGISRCSNFIRYKLNNDFIIFAQLFQFLQQKEYEKQRQRYERYEAKKKAPAKEHSDHKFWSTQVWIPIVIDEQISDNYDLISHSRSCR